VSPQKEMVGPLFAGGFWAVMAVFVGKAAINRWKRRLQRAGAQSLYKERTYPWENAPFIFFGCSRIARAQPRVVGYRCRFHSCSTGKRLGRRLSNRPPPCFRPARPYRPGRKSLIRSHTTSVAVSTKSPTGFAILTFLSTDRAEWSGAVIAGYGDFSLLKIPADAGRLSAKSSKSIWCF
jgi:hypothetical protein